MITGASGFIGRRLRARLESSGIEVIALRRAASPSPSAGRSAVVDYADVQGLTELMRQEQPERIFHVAGATKGVSYEDFQRANVMPTQNLLRALKAAEHTPSRFVLVSSLAAYGPSSPERPHAESDPRAPVEHYGKSKAEAEEVVETSGVPYTIIRPGGVYGPGDVDYFELFKSVERGFNVFFGNRDRQFSAVYVDDLIDAILAASQSPNSRDQGYFICDGTPVSWGQFQEVIVKVSERKVRELNLPEFLVGLAAIGGEMMTKIDKKPRLFNRQKAMMGRQSAWTCTSQKAQSQFDYRPQIPLERGVQLALQWYRQEGWV